MIFSNMDIDLSKTLKVDTKIVHVILTKEKVIVDPKKDLIDRIYAKNICYITFSVHDIIVIMMYSKIIRLSYLLNSRIEIN